MLTSQKLEQRGVSYKDKQLNVFIDVYISDEIFYI